jgi:hypothetical protein
MTPTKFYVLAINYGGMPWFYNGEIDERRLLPSYTPMPSLAKRYQDLSDAEFERYILGMGDTVIQPMVFWA